MKNYAGFLTVGKRRVAMGHVAFVDFNDDGSAVVHTMSSNITTSDSEEVLDLHAFVGDDQPDPPDFENYINRGLVPAEPAAPGPQLVPEHTA